MTKLSFDQWRRKVNAYVWQLAGCGLDDLPDCCLADWYDEGTSASVAARRAIRYARSEGDL
jgi:hypothetical protein